MCRKVGRELVSVLVTLVGGFSRYGFWKGLGFAKSDAWGASHLLPRSPWTFRGARERD